MPAQTNQGKQQKWLSLQTQIEWFAGEYLFDITRQTADLKICIQKDKTEQLCCMHFLQLQYCVFSSTKAWES